MSPIPITFQFSTPSPFVAPRKRQTHKGSLHHELASAKPFSFTYDSLSDTSPITSQAINGDDTVPRTQRSFERPTKRRKGSVHIAPLASEHYVTVTPLYRPIINRCLAYVTSEESLADAHALTGHPYSPESDWGNTRSFNPSDLEVARTEKPKKLNRRELKEKKEKEARVKRLVRELKGEAVEDEEEIPIIIEQTPTPSVQEETPAAIEPEKNKDKGSDSIRKLSPPQSRGPLKRTRSFNALSHAGNGVHASSPLRVVIGANGHRNTDDQPAAKQPINRRGSTTSFIETWGNQEPRRAFTHSPSGTNSMPLPEMARSPKTVPLPAGVLQPSRTRGGRSSSTALDVETGELTSMRRAATNGTTRSASVGLEGGLRERSRREVTLPNRLKDYEA
ncbi:hypothetical protein CND01090 [Cryptococcus gattii WM276]|uniref:Uncharacterized protein n=1 Tax=Cryptococcus gattii serotype B (strain WM276 / ATCC MYA-4071) TaxID=367775 RepID=E6R3N3_CRYGW|nr:uncharacterized protein CGB_D3320C [Cryptococcus gattii WM276]ADV21737.1 hypothetical protein CND01090 [Cryptococcus gattii WM276]